MRNPRIRFQHSTRAALLTALLPLSAPCRAQAPLLPAASTQAQRTPVHIGDVFYVIGPDNEPGGSGDLSINEKTIALHVHGHATSVPLSSIVVFSIAPGDKPLISGTKGKLARALPYGVGFAVTMSRPASETLTLLYRDSFNAVHAGVFVLPKETGELVTSALAATLPPTEYPKAGDLVPSKPQNRPDAETAPSPKQTRPDIEVALPSESIDGIPSALPAAVFEQVVAQLTQSGRFSHVWRAGDIRRAPDTLVLRLDLQGWKQGSARGRGFGPFTGATQIQSSVALEDRSGRILFQGKVSGSKRTDGENLDAANGLAKHVRKVLEKVPDLPTKK